jgi:AsmA family protein
MRVFWRTLAVLGAAIVLLLVAVAIAVRTVDVKQFIGPLQQRVKDATGRALEVRGGIDLKLGLEPKLVLDDVVFGNAPWGKQPQMLTAKQVEVSIKLLPLLQKHFEVTRLRLVAPTIALETDAAGKGNWEFPALRPAAEISTPAPSGATLGGFAVGDIAISDGKATYRDGKTGEVTTVVIEDLSVHARDPQSPVSGTFRGRVNDTAVALEGDFGPLEQLTRQRWPYPVAVQGEIGAKKASFGTRVTVQNNVVGLDELKLGSGASTLTGKAAVQTGGARPKVTFTLTAPALALADVAWPAKAAPSAKPAARSKYIFGEEPIDLAGLKDVDADGEITIGTLTLAEGRHLDHVHVKLALANGRLDVPVLQAGAFGGTVTGRLQIDATHAPGAALTLHAEAQNLDLGALLAAAGVKRELKGGKTEVKVDLGARGDSPRQWAASASGNVIAVAGPATLVNPKGSSDVPLDRLLEAVNPFRGVDATTELHCAVVRLPLKDGIASIDRSIAVETNKLGATASGSLDFRTETLDLSIKPQVRQGIAIAVPQVAQLVHFRGPFSSPSVGIDATATAETVARLGAAVYTGGLSILGESLFAKAAGDPGAPCQIALGRGAPASTAAAKPATASPTPADSVGKAVGHLFGR